MHYFLSIRRLSAWITLQALVAVQIFCPSAHAMRAPQRGDSRAGVEEIAGQLHAGVEETIPLSREIDLLSAQRVAASADKVWNISFSGARTNTGPDITGETFPMDLRQPVPLTDGDWATFARAGYLYAKQQLAKLKAKLGISEFTFVLARDMKSTGADGLAAQAAGMLSAAREKGVTLNFN